MKLYFVTTNSGKVSTLRNHLSPLDIEVIQEPLDLIEPQADTGEEVAVSKAHQAFSFLKKPLVVDDSAFVMNGLNGFPGPYIKFVLKTVGVEKLVKIANRLHLRSCHMESSLVYVDKLGHITPFTFRNEAGVVAKAVDETHSTEAWSDLWRIFIPQGSSKTLASLSFSQRQSLYAKYSRSTSYAQFTHWLSTGC